MQHCVCFACYDYEPRSHRDLMFVAQSIPQEPPSRRDRMLGLCDESRSFGPFPSTARTQHGVPTGRAHIVNRYCYKHCVPTERIEVSTRIHACRVTRRTHIELRGMVLACMWQS